MEHYGHPVIIDQVYCFRLQTCNVKNLTTPYGLDYKGWKTIQFQPDLLAEISPFPFPNKQQADLVLKNLTGNVLFMGELYLSTIKGVTEDVPWDAPFRRSPKCSSKLAVQPHRAILEAGKLYVQEYFKNEPFMGVHLRRGDFEHWCSNPRNGCFRPISEIIFCLKEKLRIYNISTMFLATNTKAGEIDTISNEFANTTNVRVVRLNMKDQNAKWMKPLRDAKLNTTGLLLIAMEKVICSQSTVFVGTLLSTFTTDIQRMRYGFKHANCRDSMLCDNVILNSL